MTSTIVIQNVFGVNSSTGFFFTNHPDTNPVTNSIQIGWFAQGEGVFNGKVTGININDEKITTRSFLLFHII